MANRYEGFIEKCTIAGPLCETGDLLAIDRMMTKPKEGEVLAILGVGAYGYSMASIYNLQSRPAEVIVPDIRLVSKRDDIETMSSTYVES